jgi:trimethylamine--corrinoid protein Co-methyltransferase
VVRPGTAVIALPIIFATDMKTGRSLQSSPEAMQGAALAVRFIKTAFGLPTHTYGSGADSPNVDGQSMIERSLLGVLVAAAGADILGGAGQFEVATAISPVQLVIDNEVAGMIRRMISGLTIDEETMAWDDLRSASSSGHFLETDHTLRHCRDAFNPQIFVRQSRQMWTKQGEKDFMARAAEHYRLLSGKGQPRDLPAEMMREMDRIVESADWHLKK